MSGGTFKKSVAEISEARAAPFVGDNVCLRHFESCRETAVIPRRSR